jgi:hypothetical protein
MATPDSNKDLPWAPRGAGHNLGIVTSVKFKTYESIPTWSLINLGFTQDKLEQVFELANDFVQQ